MGFKVSLKCYVVSGQKLSLELFLNHLALLKSLSDSDIKKPNAAFGTQMSSVQAHSEAVTGAI